MEEHVIVKIQMMYNKHKERYEVLAIRGNGDSAVIAKGSERQEIHRTAHKYSLACNVPFIDLTTD